MSRRHLLTLLKLLVAAGLIGWVVDSAGWDTIHGALVSIDRSGWLQGLSLIVMATCLAILRWHLLMRSVGLHSTPWVALRLGFIGVFASNVVPGLTGGDLVKAIYISRENPGQRTAAVVSVIVDRIIGIVALALIAAVVLPLDIERFGQAAWGIYGFLAASAVGSVLVLSRRAKDRLRPLLGRSGRMGRSASGFLGRVSAFLGKTDDAVSMYRHRIGAMVVAILLSFVVHLLIIMSLKIFGDAMARGGMAAIDANKAQVTTAEEAASAVAQYQDYVHLESVRLTEYCSIVPVIMIISALPITPAGWGVGEKAFQHFFLSVSVSPGHSAALSLTYRITTLLVSLVGGVLLVVDRKRVLEAASSAQNEEGEPRSEGCAGPSTAGSAALGDSGAGPA